MLLSDGPKDMSDGQKDHMVPWKIGLDTSLAVATLPVDVAPDTSAPGRAGRHYPLAFYRWTSFITDARNFDISPFDCALDWKDFVDPQPHISNEVDVAEALKVNVGFFFKGSTLGSMYKPSTKEYFCVMGRQRTLIEPVGKQVCGVIEVQTPWTAAQLSDASFVELFNLRTLEKYTARATAQLVGSMIDNCCKYGVLSTYNGTRFFAARDNDHFDVSDVITANASTTADTVTLRRAFAYWMSLCTDPAGVLGTSRLPLNLNFDPTADPTVDKRLPGQLIQMIHNRYVDWSELEFLGGLGSGRCGNVALVRWGETELALKLFDIGKHGPESFESEVRAYAMLQTSNVRAVKLVLVTHSPSGQVFGLGLQLGHSLPPLESWSQQQRDGACEALRSLLEEGGLIHNDVRDCNFVQDDAGKVLVIDLEDTRRPESQKDAETYLANAWRELQNEPRGGKRKLDSQLKNTCLNFLFELRL